MFGKDFYPTPPHVISMMNLDCAGKTVLEPSAGKGDLVDQMHLWGAKEILACELHKDLAQIVKSKSRFLKHDFLLVQPEEISHIDMIVMNPPFSNGVKHLSHAWDIAPAGCELVSLLNYENLEKDFSRDRRKLKQIIEEHGTSTNLGPVFSTAERKTDTTEIALIKLYKPKTDSDEFAGFFIDEDPEEEQANGIMPFNAVRDAVQRYVHSVKCFEEHRIIADRMNQLTAPFGLGGFSFNIEHQNQVSTKDDFKKEVQKKAWKYLFGVMNLEKYVTSGVMKDINKFSETQQKVPFTMRNIYKMFEIIIGTREQTFKRSLEEAVDMFTQHTHENRYYVEGWKTNAGHLLNKKIIIPCMMEMGFSDYLSPRYSQYQDKAEDLIKVLCSLTATDFNSIPSLYNFCQKTKMQPNTWHQWGFFQIKGFKKGTLHLKFKDHKVWELINREYAKIKGQVLPEKI